MSVCGACREIVLTLQADDGTGYGVTADCQPLESVWLCLNAAHVSYGGECSWSACNARREIILTLQADRMYFEVVDFYCQILLLGEIMVKREVTFFKVRY